MNVREQRSYQSETKIPDHPLSSVLEVVFAYIKRVDDEKNRTLVVVYMVHLLYDSVEWKYRNENHCGDNCYENRRENFFGIDDAHINLV